MRAHDAFALEIDDHKIRIRPDGDGTLARIDPVDLCRTARGTVDQQVERDAALAAVMQERRQVCAQDGDSRARAMQPLLRLLGGATA